MQLSPTMELNLRRIAQSDPQPVHLAVLQAEALERRGLVTAQLMRWPEGAECRLTDKGRDWIDAN